MANRKTDEVVLTNLLGSAIGTDTLLKGYFNNDSRSVIGAMVAGNDMNNVMSFIDKTNYNYRSRKFTGKSDLGGLQQQVVNLYMTSENVMSFEEHLVTNPNLLDSEIEYNGLNELKNDFDIVKENMAELQKVA